VNYVLCCQNNRKLGHHILDVVDSEFASTQKSDLNKIKVAKVGDVSNVCLAWEGVNEVKGDTSYCQYLRVLVIATRHIMPFDQLIRLGSGVGVLSG